MSKKKTHDTTKKTADTKRRQFQDNTWGDPKTDRKAPLHVAPRVPITDEGDPPPKKKDD